MTQLGFCSAAIGLAALIAGIAAPGAGAQTVRTLPSVELTLRPVAPAGQPPARTCFQDPAQDRCQGGERSGRAFSLNDVLNLGIIDRSELAGEEAGAQPIAARAADPLPSVDLRILFDYASAALRDDQLAPLQMLAADLRGVDFTRARLVLMGHSDAVGSRAYNLDLSLRRAEAVAAFLGRAAGIPPARIRSSGMAFDYLLYPDDPANPANRRVQILLVE